MKDLELLLVLACVLVLLSILASKVTRRSGVPALLLFLAIGMLAGSEGLGGIYFDDAGLARSVGVVALALILFSGGLDTRWASIRPVLGRGIVLATAGTLVTAGLVGGVAMLVTGLPALESLLLGAVVSSTDAAAVFSVLRARQVRLPASVRDLLELESGSNDPMAVFLTVSLISLITTGEGSLLQLAASFVLQMGLGARARLRVRTRHGLGHQPRRPATTTASTRSSAWRWSSSPSRRPRTWAAAGSWPCYVAGLVLGDRAYIHKRSLTRFHDGLAWLMQHRHVPDARPAGVPQPDPAGARRRRPGHGVPDARSAPAHRVPLAVPAAPATSDGRASPATDRAGRRCCRGAARSSVLRGVRPAPLAARLRGGRRSCSAPSRRQHPPGRTTCLGCARAAGSTSRRARPRATRA